MAMFPGLYRQTKLDVSTDKLLSLNKFPSRPEQSQDAYILKLPNELLEYIFSLVSEPEELWRTRCLVPKQKASRVLILVCLRFYEIGIPLLYRSIYSTFGACFVPPSKAVRALHRTLRDRPPLRSHCQTLHIHVPDVGATGDASPQKWAVAYDIISWLPNVRDFVIHGGFERWPVIQWDFISRVSQCMLNIEKLSLSRESWNLGLAPLFEFVRCPHLKLLQIHGASNLRGNATEPKLAESEISQAHFTTLILSDFTESFSALRELIRWPKKLHHFSYFGTEGGATGWNTATLGTLLALHKQTLQSITFVSLFAPVSSRDCIDVSDYPALRSITMPVRDMDCTVEEAASKLLAPRLESFTWSFCLNAQCAETLEDFSESRATWLRRFVALAMARKSTLRKVHIELSPHDWYPSLEEVTKASYVYPVDRMDDIAAEFKPHGVIVTHEKDDRTREEINKAKAGRPTDALSDVDEI